MRRLAVGLCTTVVLAGCGIGGEGEFEQVGRDDLAGLDETTTTSSTSPPTTTVVPPSSVTSVARSTTTLAETESVELYFLDGNQLAPIPVNLAPNPTPTRVMAALEDGEPSGEAGIGLRTFVPPSLIRTVVPSDAGFATVDLAGVTFERIAAQDQRLAIAQIVLTLTRRPGIGQVRFTVDGDPLAVPGQGGVQTEQPVSREDYQSLLRDQPVTETTPPTTTESTVVPETLPATTTG